VTPPVSRGCCRDDLTKRLSAEIVVLVGTDVAHDPDQARQVREIAIEELDVVDNAEPTAG
jgi:hypothetical protein